MKTVHFSLILVLFYSLVSLSYAMPTQVGEDTSGGNPEQAESLSFEESSTESPKTEWEMALADGASLYKIMTLSDYAAMERNGFSPSAFDRVDGPKIHLSIGSQWQLRQRLYFGGQAVKVVKFDPSGIVQRLKMENKRDDGDFCMSHPIADDLSAFNRIQEVLHLDALE
jgi:uncharacterized protein (DUF952 family)